MFGPDTKKIRAAFANYQAAMAAVPQTNDVVQALAEILVLKQFLADLAAAFK
jgi:hypothetical protein